MGAGIEMSVRGTDQLERVAAELKRIGGGELRKEMLKGVRRAAKPAADAAKQAVRGLPARRNTGLREQIARAITVRTKTSGKGAGVRISVQSGKLPPNKTRMPSLMNKGSWRHPLFGNRDDWYPQDVEAGWFTDTLKGQSTNVRHELAAVLDDIEARIERSI